MIKFNNVRPKKKKKISCVKCVIANKNCVDIKLKLKLSYWGYQICIDSALKVEKFIKQNYSKSF